MISSREPRLGVDIGRVIIEGPESSDDDTAFFDGDEEALLATPEVEGAIGSIARLVDLFGGRVWLVSQCGPRVEGRTQRWLEGHDFYARTALPREHVRFCRERAEKRLHCEELELTHFVDDRPEVHASICGVVDCHVLIRGRGAAAPGYVRAAASWPEAEEILRLSLP